MSLLLLSLLACGPGLKRAWEVNPGDYSPVPAITRDGTLITSSYAPYTTQGTTMALDPADGQQLWSYNVENGSTMGVVLDADDDVVVADSTGLVGLDPADGSEVWSVTLPNRPGAMAVDATQGIVYTVYQAAGGTPELAAIQDGAVRWTLPCEAGWGNLAVGADGTLFLATETTARAISTAGEVLWEVTLPAAAVFGVLDSAHFVLSLGPSTESAASVAVLSRADGAVAWSTEQGCSTEPVIGADGTIYCGSYAGILAMDGETGALLWSSGENTCDVAIGGDGRLYALAMLLEDEAFPELGSNLEFTVASASDGEILWREMQYEALDSSGGAPNFDGRRVYYAGGYFYAYVYAFDGGPGLGGGPWPRGGADAGNRRQEQ
ncbi:MAG: PQQ-binding-like beta-propeller repeat protein [Pseudomonadota bacterium]